jgi:hypothetical protein
LNLFLSDLRLHCIDGNLFQHLEAHKQVLDQAMVVHLELDHELLKDQESNEDNVKKANSKIHHT